MDPFINPTHFIEPLFCCLLLLNWALLANGAPASALQGAQGEQVEGQMPSPAPAPTIYNPDKVALINLKGSLSLYNPNISLVLYDWGGNDEEEDACKWNRVHCDNESNVIYLDFRQARLQGPLPQHAFSSFPFLSSLFLSFNNFSQSIPMDLGLCTNLQILDLSYNSLSSSIPLELGFLHNLRQVDLSSNSITGQIDYGIFENWTSLYYLNLSNNEFYGHIPYGYSWSLGVLDLSNNNFNGSLPEKSIGQIMPNLQGLRLGGNKLIGEIPPSFFDTCGSNLEELDVSWNSLWGSIPSTMGNCSALKMLGFSRNYLSGYVPKELGNLLQLHSLILGDNYFNGVPFELSFLKSLAFLDLKRNALSGGIPSFLANNEALQYLWLNSNNFSGSFPPQLLQNLTLLRYLDLSNNALVGSIPDQLQNLSSLQFLFMSGNQFTGSIPRELGNIKGLQVLDLSFNSLNGSIPSTIGNLENLLWLMLSHNSLTGPLPSEIVNCSSLLWLNAANNKLSGALPVNMGLMGNEAAVMTFDKNSEVNYAPPLPDYAGDCSFVKRWVPTEDGLNDNLYDYKSCAAVWNKLIRGRLSIASCPSKLNFTTSGYVQLSNNVITGSIPGSLGFSLLLSFLFLANNELSGSIPDTLGHLPLINLDLSHNSLNGAISPSLGNLSCLGVLDLSFNNLSGNIPADLEHLRQLYSFNVSYNAELWGPVPTGGQFPSFPSSSYLGNVHLCFNDGVLRENVSAGPPICPPATHASAPPAASAGARRHDTVSMTLKKYMKGGAVAGVAAAGALVVVGAVGVWANVAATRKKQRRRGGSEVNSLIDKGVLATEKWAVEMFHGRRRDLLSYADLEWATCCFHEKYVAGRGGAAVVYKANLGGGSVVAVKKLEFDERNSEEFLAHLRQVASLRHPHLVPIIGCIFRGPYHLLVLRFMHHGSLRDVLHGEPTMLDWPRRLNIANGVAEVLAFLHHRCSPRVIHGDVKPSNILLDRQFKPHLADCGLSRAIPVGTNYTLISPTYAAPEQAPALDPTPEGDVYSFGLVLLELATGHSPAAGSCHGRDNVRACEMVKWVRSTVTRKAAEELVDTALSSTCADVRDVVRLLHVGLACTQDNPTSRPSMDDVAQGLAELSSVEDHRLPCIYASPA